MKRFYSDVDIQKTTDGWQVTLDGRGIKTVGGRVQSLPNQALAEALAQEWRDQGDTLDAASFKHRDMADYALDVVAPDTQAVIGTLLQYGETDTLCYRAARDEALFARQEELWEPIVKRAEQRLGAAITRISGIIHQPQSPLYVKALKARLDPLSSFELAALMSLASLTASLIIAMEAREEGASCQALWNAAHLEEHWQAQLWGRDEEAQARLKARERDFGLAWQFLKLSRV